MFNKTIGYGKLMKEYRLKEIKSLFPMLFWNKEASSNDPWWRFRSAVDKFNRTRKEMINVSPNMVMDEAMLSIIPRTTKTGGLPNILYVARKPKLLGTEFKCMADGETGVMLCMEICEGKVRMQQKEFAKELGISAACALRLMEEGKLHRGDANKSLYLGDSWFGSVKVAAEIAKSDQHCCFNVKTSTKHSPKKWLDERVKNYPGETWITLKEILQDMPLYFIGYKYNKQKVLSFVFTPGAGTIMKSTNSYEARFPDKFGNLHVRKVPHPDMLTSYFSKCNVIDVHNQSRQHDLAIEESWVTSEPYFRLCTTIIGIVVTDAWKLVRFRSKKWSNERIIAISNRLCYSILSDISCCAYPVDELMIETQQSGH